MSTPSSGKRVPAGGTKQEIVAAAEEVISQKGIQDATISEIASRAGVTDSVIYHYFKNKEHLLFYITAIHLEEALRLLQEQLEGILEPISRLSKMVWFHLRYNERHREYSRILLFECRSNRNFYHHEVYGLIRKYSGVMLSILVEGANRGVFRDDVNMRLVRDLVLGAMDWETLRILANPDLKHTVEDVREIVDLVCAMIEIRHRPQEKDLSKSTRILTAAENLFSEKGYWSSSIAEIARLADVAEGTVYEYFKNKEDLLFAIPKMRFKEHVESLTEVFEIKAPIRKLKRFIRHHFVLYMTQPKFLKTFLLDIQLNARFYDAEAYTYFQEYSSMVDRILEEGKADGSIRLQVNPIVFKNLFLGGFSHMALRWVILTPGANLDRMSEIDQVVELLTLAVANE